MADLAAAARERLGRVDVLVNNAGAGFAAPLAGVSLADWERMLAVNATSVFLCTKAFLPGMTERGWGRVVTVASVSGLGGARYVSAYSAAKHAALGLTRCVAAEVARSGVTVNAICPGYVATPMTDETLARIEERTGRTREEALDSILATMPQGRLITTDEVAHVVLSLCAEDARGINGQAIVIDGGERT